MTVRTQYTSDPATRPSNSSASTLSLYQRGDHRRLKRWRALRDRVVAGAGPDDCPGITAAGLWGQAYLNVPEFAGRGRRGRVLQAIPRADALDDEAEGNACLTRLDGFAAGLDGQLENIRGCEIGIEDDTGPGRIGAALFSDQDRVQGCVGRVESAEDVFV